MREEERKYEVGPLFALPELSGAAPEGGRITEQPPLTLRATYYDTDDLRLARGGASLRHRSGESGPPWTVKLPSGEANIRQEIAVPGSADRIPRELVSLVTAYTRGAPLASISTLQTIRHRYLVTDAAGTALAELVDDTVTVLDGETVRSRFRELEVERRAGPRSVLDRVEQVLLAAGAVRPTAFTPKIVRALGPRASEPPELPPPQPLGTAPTAADVLVEALRTETGRLLAHDPAVRLAPDDPDGLEQLRTACRRLRTDLRGFAPLFQEPAADPGPVPEAG
ncbi:MAG: inorganic triphosphatase, partial [Micromonosporaceae bacterium]